MPKKTEQPGKGGKPVKRTKTGQWVKGSGAHVDAGRPPMHRSPSARASYWEERSAAEIRKYATDPKLEQKVSSIDKQTIMRLFESQKEGGLPSYKDIMDRKFGKPRQSVTFDTPIIDGIEVDKREVARQVAYLLSLGLPQNGDTGATRKQSTIAEPRSPRTGNLLVSEDDPVHGHP